MTTFKGYKFPCSPMQNRVQSTHPCEGCICQLGIDIPELCGWLRNTQPVDGMAELARELRNARKHWCPQKKGVVNNHQCVRLQRKETLRAWAYFCQTVQERQDKAVGTVEPKRGDKPTNAKSQPKAGRDHPFRRKALRLLSR